MHGEDEIISRCPLRDRIFSFIIATTILINSIPYFITAETTNEAEIIEASTIHIEEPVIIEEMIEMPVLKSDDEIISEINAGIWGNGEERKNKLISAGYDYNRIQSKVDELYAAQEPIRTKNVAVKHVYTSCLTKSGGVYHNPYTGLKETWYSQRVLPGGGLKIPGRHVNKEGFVCDGDGYICVASSTYPKGTVIETSRGMGKVYDSGCAPGILDIYVDW